MQTYELSYNNIVYIAMKSMVYFFNMFYDRKYDKNVIDVVLYYVHTFDNEKKHSGMTRRDAIILISRFVN